MSDVRRAAESRCRCCEHSSVRELHRATTRPIPLRGPPREGRRSSPNFFSAVVRREGRSLAVSGQTPAISLRLFLSRGAYYSRTEP